MWSRCFAGREAPSVARREALVRGPEPLDQRLAAQRGVRHRQLAEQQVRLDGQHRRPRRQRRCRLPEAVHVRSRARPARLARARCRRPTASVRSVGSVDRPVGAQLTQPAEQRLAVPAAPAQDQERVGVERLGQQVEGRREVLARHLASRGSCSAGRGRRPRAGTAARRRRRTAPPARAASRRRAAGRWTAPARPARSRPWPRPARVNGARPIAHRRTGAPGSPAPWPAPRRARRRARCTWPRRA